MLAGCYQSEEISPGNSEYPITTPTPSRNVDLTVIIPANLSIKFGSAWIAAADDKHCARTIGIRGSVSLVVARPIDFVVDGITYRGHFASDAFKPGRCQWRFQGVAFEPIKPKGIGRAVIRYDDNANTPEEIGLDEWCIHTHDEGYPEYCAGLLADAARRVGIQVPEGLAPVEKMSATIGPGTKRVTIVIHDFDALKPDTPK